MFNDKSKRGKIVQAAMRLAEREGWRRITLADIAREAGVSLAAMHRRFGSKTAVLAAFVDAVDNAMLKKAGTPDMDAPARDRVFEVVMTRLDVLKPYKGAIARIRSDCRCMPGPGSARMACVALNTAQWMLTAAGIRVSGGKGCVRTTGLLCVYNRVVDIWLRDDTPDQARTMAALDRELRSGERQLKWLEAICCDVGRVLSRFAPRRDYGPSERAGGSEPSGRDAGPAPSEQPSAG